MAFDFAPFAARIRAEGLNVYGISAMRYGELSGEYRFVPSEPHLLHSASKEVKIRIQTKKSALGRFSLLPITLLQREIVGIRNAWPYLDPRTVRPLDDDRFQVRPKRGFHLFDVLLTEQFALLLLLFCQRSDLFERSQLIDSLDARLVHSQSLHGYFTIVPTVL
jgi:hypothetical protein